MMGHLVEAARLTGAREDELIRALVHQLDDKLKQITLIGKRNKQRTIDGTVFGAYDYLTALPRFFKSPRLFWHHEGEGYSNFASHFHRLVKQTAKNKIDFQPFRFHDLRHLHAIEFLKSRAGTIHDLQFRLGHSSVMTTEMYLRSGLLTGEEIRAAMYGIAKPALKVIGGTAWPDPILAKVEKHRKLYAALCATGETEPTGEFRNSEYRAWEQNQGQIIDDLWATKADLLSPRPTTPQGAVELIDCILEQDEREYLLCGDPDNPCVLLLENLRAYLQAVAQA
jgi:Phage integrase family